MGIDPAGLRYQHVVANVDRETFWRHISGCLAKQEVWILKFFVPWCPHCQALLPRLKEGYFANCFV